MIVSFHSRAISRGAAALVVLLAAVPCARVAASDVGSAGVSLQDVLDGAIAHHPAVLVGMQQTEAARGQLLAAQEAFGTRVKAEGLALRQDESASALPGLPAAASGDFTQGVRWVSSVTKPSRLGPALGVKLQVDRSLDTQMNGSVPTLSLWVPLARDAWGGGGDVKREEAASLDVDASDLALRHTVSEVARSGAESYWAYLAATQRLAALTASEHRAQKIVEETEVLVKADERAAAEVNQARGYLAAQKAARLLAEQEVSDAWAELVLAMADASVDEAPPATPTTPFPDVVVPEAIDASDRVETALRRRLDLLASVEGGRSAELVVAAARSDLRPRLDLNVEAGYVGRSTSFLGSFHRNVPGAELTATLTLELPVANGAARGRLVQSTAAQRQQKITHDDLARRVRSRVRVSIEALGRSALALRESQEAVRLLQITVDNEKRKFANGVSTLFDVLQAENGLTSATLSEIASRRAYAGALVALRFETGTLIHDGPQAAASAADLLTPDTPEARKE